MLPRVRIAVLVSGLALMPAASKTRSAAAPHGTSGAQTASARSSRAKSARPLTPAGFPAGTAISRWFAVNTVGSSASPASVTTAICGSSAEANTSAGAPWVIWVASAELPAKLNWMSRSGLSAVS